MSDAGGDPACWLERVCDACGGYVAAGEEHRCRTPVRAAGGEDGAAPGSPATDDPPDATGGHPHPC